MRFSNLGLVLLALHAAPIAAQASWTSATGRVTDAETGKPIPDAAVDLLICDAADRPATCRFRRWSGRSATDARGAFEIPSARPRVYAVRVTHPGYEAVQPPPYDEVERLRRNRETLASEGPPHYSIALRPLPRQGGCSTRR